MPLLVNFDYLSEPLFGFLPILHGQYAGFNAYWFSQVGVGVTLTLLSAIIIPHMSKLLMPLKKIALRWYDRADGDQTNQPFKTR